MRKWYRERRIEELRQAIDQLEALRAEMGKENKVLMLDVHICELKNELDDLRFFIK